ncbi:hypothetical protein FEE96_06850 [Parasedimentitalea maritima]|uniref:DUF4304 domain-containing protein n=1 Tax=Parasedimentitalea maritima TaxID=2578117 RepID=A0ABY2UWR0_9RHOB|nr:hypothetical protein [Zongyanglinia marina]TLP67062.1 hypothetical protein FEE96_06850 [Zongyanglinia marina]
MKAKLDLISSVLEEAEYSCSIVEVENGNCLAFENRVSFGFIHCYSDLGGLLRSWRAESEKTLSMFQFQIRSSGDKAWNAYSVFLAFERPDESAVALLARIEEDLSGTRKIARGVNADEDGIRQGLLPLLRIQNPPVLGVVDMVAEIRARSAGLPTKAVDAFLLDAPNSEVLRLMGRSDET